MFSKTTHQASVFWHKVGCGLSIGREREGRGGERMGGPKRWGWGGEPSDALTKSGDDDRSFSTRRIVESTCKTEEVEPGRFVRKCDKTEKILRDCIGRPSEVVESTTEHTEDDVTDELKRGMLPFGSSSSSGSVRLSGVLDGFEALEKGVRSDIEAIERGFSEFLNAADEMTNRFFGSFEFPSPGGGMESPVRGIPSERQPGIHTSKKVDESAYSEYGSEVVDV